MTTSEGLPSPAERAVDLLPAVGQAVAKSVAERKPVDSVIRAFADRGLVQILAPRSYGGEEATARQFLELVELVATVDGSAAWTIMTLNEEMELACAHLPPESMVDVVGTSPPVVVAGSGLTKGTAIRTEGGWTLSGQWQFVTGGPAADMILAGAVVDGTQAKQLCYVLVPVDQVEILDTWDTVGLRGTGSHDVRMDDVFVPDERVGLTSNPPVPNPDATLFRLPAGLRFPFPKVGVASGIAKAALATFVELAAIKRARVGKAMLREHADAQLAVAEADALIGSGRAFVLEMLDEVWGLAIEGRPVPAEVHARTRLACTTSVANSVRAVELLATAAGTTANLANQPLHRQLADVRAVPQHFMVGGYHRLNVGRIMLGLKPDDPLF